MEATGYLLAVNIVTWVGILGYLFILGRQKKRILQRLSQLETKYNEKHGQF